MPGRLLRADEFAPGIPKGREIKPVPFVHHERPEVWGIALQQHEAERAGLHTDLRLVDSDGHAHSWALPGVSQLPRPGDKVLAVRQPTHTAEYAAREGAFTIESGYGKGRVVGTGLKPVEIVRATPGHIRFNVYTGRGPEEYNLIETPKGAILHNITSTAESGVRGETGQKIPNAKPDYKELHTDHVKFDDPNEIHQAKVDGAHVTFHLLPDRHMKVFSFRPTERETGVIEHTHKLPDYRTLKTPKELGGTVLRGELYGVGRDGKPLPAETTGGLLNASVWNSREKQKELGAHLDHVVFDVVRYRGKDMEKAPYEEKLKVLQEVTSKVPFLKMPPTAESTAEKVKLFTSIQAGSHPLTSEGIVIWKRDHERPTKAKFRPDVDAEVVGVTPGKGKHTGAIGALQVRLPGKDAVTNVGTGFSDQLRREIAANPTAYVGRVAKVRTMQVFPSGRLRAPSFSEFHIEKGKQSSSIHAYVIGPSGAGKSTYVKKNFPKDKFHVVHSDDYAEPSTKQPGRVKINWTKALEDAKKSGKPIVIDAMHVNPELMREAKHKLLVDPGKVRTVSQLIGRRGLRGKKNGYSLSPMEKLERFDQKARPVAEGLGFQKVSMIKTAGLPKYLRGTLTRRPFGVGVDTMMVKDPRLKQRLLTYQIGNVAGRDLASVSSPLSESEKAEFLERVMKRVGPHAEVAKKLKVGHVIPRNS